MSQSELLLRSRHSVVMRADSLSIQPQSHHLHLRPGSATVCEQALLASWASVSHIFCKGLLQKRASWCSWPLRVAVRSHGSMGKPVLRLGPGPGVNECSKWLPPSTSFLLDLSVAGSMAPPFFSTLRGNGLFATKFKVSRTRG